LFLSALLLIGVLPKNYIIRISLIYVTTTCYNIFSKSPCGTVYFYDAKIRKPAATCMIDYFIF